MPDAVPSTRSNFTFNIALTISNLIFPLVSFPYISRVIGPEGIGRVQFLTTFAQYFVLFAALGIPLYGMREVAKASGDRKALDKVFSEIFILNVITSVLAVLVYLIVIFSVPRFHAELDWYMITGLIILLGFTSIDWLYSGLQNFKHIAIRSVVIKIVSLAAMFMFVTTAADAKVYLCITVFSILGNNLWNLFLLKKNVSLKFQNLELKKHLPTLLMLFSTGISTSIYTVMDTLILGFLTDNRTVGFYTAAIKINKIAIPVIISLGIVLMPQIAKSMADRDERLTNQLLSKSFNFICFLGIPIAFGLYAVAPEMMTVFSGPEFAPAILTMQISAPLVFLIGLGHIFGLQILVQSNNHNLYLYATFCGVIMSLLLNFLFIVLFKDKGAALATVCGEIVVSAVSYFYVVKRLKYNFDWSMALKAALPSIAFIPLAMIFRAIIPQPLLALLLTAIASSGIYFSIQLFVYRNPMCMEGWTMLLGKLNMLKSGKKP
jgi:O-antigen/teichoic acid export membrane protein